MVESHTAGKMMKRMSGPTAQKWILVAGCYLLAILYGLAWVGGRWTAVLFLIALVYNNTVTMLVWLDSGRRRRAMPMALLMLIFFTWPVALPIYYGVTRGWKGLLKGALFTVSLWLISFIAAACVFPCYKL